MRGWLLDTNVLSELVRPKPEPMVINWLRTTAPERTFVSILTLGEIDQGIASLKLNDGRRDRYDRFRTRVEADFAGRILSLDDETVRLWGALSGRYRLDLGGKAPVIDAMLAAMAQRFRLHVATRNVQDIRRLGASAFNPWSDDPAHYPLQS
jgi:predicted nucleic acid-binding protein